MEHLNDDSFESDDRKPSPVPPSYGTNNLNWKHLEMEQFQNDIREPSIHEPTRRKLSGYEPSNTMLSEPDVDYDTTATGLYTSPIVGSPKRRSNMEISIVPSAASIRRKARESSRYTKNASTLQSSSIISSQSNLETAISTTKGIDSTNQESQKDSSIAIPTTTTTTTLETTISTKPPKEHVWTGEDEAESTTARRKAIQEIMKDSTLSSVERNRKIQELIKGTIPSSSSPIPSTLSLNSTSPDVTTVESTNKEKTAQKEKVKWTGEPENDAAVAKRKAIQEIMKNPNLTPAERQSQIQSLMIGNTRHTNNHSNNSSTLSKPMASSLKVESSDQDGHSTKPGIQVMKGQDIRIHQKINRNTVTVPIHHSGASLIESSSTSSSRAAGTTAAIGNQKDDPQSTRHVEYPTHLTSSSTSSRSKQLYSTSGNDVNLDVKPGFTAVRGHDVRISAKSRNHSRNTTTTSPLKLAASALPADLLEDSSKTESQNEVDDIFYGREYSNSLTTPVTSAAARSKQLYSTSGNDMSLDVKPGFTAVRGHDARISAKSRNHSRNTTTTSPLKFAASALPSDLLEDSSNVESQNDVDDIFYGREYSNSLTTPVTPAAAMLPLEEPDTMMLTTARPGVTAVRGKDSRISRKVQTSIIKPANLKGTDNDGSFKDVTKSILDGKDPPLVQPGAVASHNDSRVSRKIQSALTHTSSPIRNTSMAYNNSLTSDVEEPEAILPGTVTRMSLEQVSRVARKVGSIARGHPTTTTISSTNGVSLEDISQQDMEKFEDEPGMGLSRPGTAVASRDSRVARKIAQAHNVGAKASKDDSAVGRKIGRSPRRITTKTNSASGVASMDENSQEGPVIGAVATLGDDPAANKKSFVRDELFATEEGEEINPDDYLMQQVKATQEAQLNLLKGGGKNKKGSKDGKDDDDDTMGLHKDGDAAVPKAPGAFAVKGGRGGWFTGGFRQRAARGMMSRNKSRAILDAEVKALNPDEIDEDDYEDWWDRADKPTIIVGACILIFAIIAITVPVVLLKTKEEPPTPSPTSSRFFLVDEFQSLFTNVTNPKAFQNPSSPQSLALNWIAYDDEMQLDPYSLSAIQRYICMVLYFSNNGTQWKYPSSAVEWGSGVHECEWDYITCETSTVIDKLNLLGVGMVGEIVPEIMYLSELKSLDVGRNALRESKFPTVLLQMTKLRYLYLDEIRLKGTIPTEIGRLSKLEDLYLSANSLSGSLPTELRSLSLLRGFQVNMNYLEGDIFGIVEGWPKLQILDFGNNDFDGTFPSILPKSLTNLRMDRNSISGTLPTELGLLTNLKSLIVTQNFRFTGQIPTELGNCKSLELLHVDSNNIKGSIPTELGKLSKIQDIRLAQNELSGSIPTHLGRCTSLTQLDLNNNDFSSIVPSQIGQLSNLELLWLQSTNLSGSMPNEICQLRQQKLDELQADCKFVETAQVQCAEPTCCTGCL